MSAATQPTPRIRVLVADDHPVVRRMVRTTLEQDPRIDLCGEATDGAQAVEEAKKVKPDVVVLNVSIDLPPRN
jgi:chemotaxis response regulator CheB